MYDCIIIYLTTARYLILIVIHERCGCIYNFQPVNFNVTFGNVILRICQETTLRLTHWGRDKMAAVSQTTFSNEFSWMKMVQFWLRFPWSFILGVQLTMSSVMAQRQAIIRTNDGLVLWRIYASLGLNELLQQAPPLVSSQHWFMWWLDTIRF